MFVESVNLSAENTGVSEYFRGKHLAEMYSRSHTFDVSLSPGLFALIDIVTDAVTTFLRHDTDFN